MPLQTSIATALNPDIAVSLHGLRNCLAVISLQADILASESSLHGASREALVEIQAAAAQASRFMKSLTALPQEAPIKEVVNTSPSAGAKRRATILLIDDESSLRRPLCECLRKNGYEVLDADSAEQGIEIWKANKGEIDLVMVDVHLGRKVTGDQLVAQILNEKDSVRAILCSGDEFEISDRARLLGPRVWWIHKPFEWLALSRLIQQSLA